MAKTTNVTQAQIIRSVRAALESGLRVTGISPDGTVIIDSSEVVSDADREEASDDADWSD